MREANDLQRITKLKAELTMTPLVSMRARASKLIFGAAMERAELAVREYALLRFGGLELNEALLRSVSDPRSGIRHPMPREWQAILTQRGFPVATMASTIAWYWEMWRLLGAGALTILRLTAEAGSSMIRGRGVGSGHFAHFHSVTAANCPTAGPDGRSHDIISWYLQWAGRPAELTSVSHEVGRRPDALHDVDGVAVVANQPAVRPLTRLGSALRFTAWGAAAFMLAAMHLLVGRWWHALILREAATAAVMRLQRSEQLARDYLFHNSSWIYRPLWTYEAERRGSRVLFYLYSTNTEGFKTSRGYPPSYGWGAASWPHYMVWNEHQADFIHRAVGPHADAMIVGPIWFASSATALPRVPNSAAVFDVTPARDSYYQRLGIEFEYYVPDVVNAFLAHVQRATEDVGLTMVWKRKRQMGAITHRRYRRHAMAIGNSPNVRVLDPDISAIRLVDAADVVISLPFTSTAIIGRERGKPSCYYDPTGRIFKDDRAAHGIPVVSGIDDLRAWLLVAARGSTLAADEA